MRRPIAVVIALVLLVGACGGKKEAVKPRAKSTTTTVPARFPLTGLPVDNAAAANRPVLTVKIENPVEVPEEVAAGR